MYVGLATLPFWFLTLTSSPGILIPAAYTVIYCVRRRARRRGGCCVACGYNLTGNMSGRCPECGETAPPTKQPVGAETGKG